MERINEKLDLDIEDTFDLQKQTSLIHFDEPVERMKKLKTEMISIQASKVFPQENNNIFSRILPVIPPKNHITKGIKEFLCLDFSNQEVLKLTFQILIEGVDYFIHETYKSQIVTLM